MYNSNLENLSIEKIKKMSIEELTNLCSEIRQAILEICSIHGGHLSSNLGIVELTVACYYVFNAPIDKIIFDVSHQTYTEKIITGRYKELYESLRTKNGISGFSKYSESIYDTFETGHSSTSISAAIGFVEARKSLNNIGEVVSIIGDASISNGLSFEALNYLGEKKDDKAIIIINDNNMSVSKNVGSLARTFNKIRINKKLKGLKKLFSSNYKYRVQTILYKNKLFSSLGLKYFENINGHDLKELIKYFTYAANYNKSIVLHCKTVKGYGYHQAEIDYLGLYHATQPFNIEKGISLDVLENKNAFGQAFSKVIEEEINIKQNKLIRVINPGMSFGCGFDNLKANNPNNFIDVGIAEENAVVIAASLAQAGMQPVVSCYSTFLQRGFDEILHDIGRTKEHVIFLVDHAGIVSKDGSTHQGIYDVAMFNSIPNIKLLSIISPLDVKNAWDYAVSLKTPVVIRYPHEVILDNYQNIPNISYYKKQEILRESKNQKYFISYGTDILDLLNSNRFSDFGIISCNTINEFDDDFFKKLNKCTLITYEQVIYNNSMSNLLLDYLYQNNLLNDVKLVINTLPNTYLEVGTVDEIKKDYQLDLDNLKIGE